MNVINFKFIDSTKILHNNLELTQKAITYKENHSLFILKYKTKYKKIDNT